ncbi:pantoate-beta-alanine ligase [Coemansia sp. IMI 203386]|nr:pantoate-beta-alanine ligase [Coemansia sp. IMI 203386]
MSNSNTEAVPVFHTVSALRIWREEQHKQGKTIGLVPTMGALHSGHLTLVSSAQQTCDVVVVSIFVNPAQFAPHEDLDQYPRTLPQDIEKLAQYNCVVVFAPSVSEMGVATVVSKLFHIVMPEMAFFGQKDIQQCCVLKTMVEDLHFPIKLKVVPTVRDPEDGLALSSRNVYLTEEQRAKAPALYRGLCAAQELYSEGITGRKELIDAVVAEAAKENLDIEYVCLSSPETLEEIDSVTSTGAILSSAWRMGNTRLIDNILIGFEF